jgi:hypothetical protein
MMRVNRGVLQQCLLIGAAVFAIVWSVARACVQSLTLDEADTYFWFAGRPASYIWYPFPNNHILNTLLMWIATRVFGTYSITVRAPALLGASLYIVVCYFLCLTITSRFLLKLSLFVCLTYNPFILDFMVAARGDSLANAFLLAALAIPVWHRESGQSSLPKSCLLTSLALSLSFIANFSYGLVDLAAFAAILIWAVRSRGKETAARIVGCCVLPGLAVTVLLGGYPLAHWPRKELWYGAKTLREMWQSVVQASLYRLAPGFRRAGLYRAMSALKSWLLPTLGALCGLRLVITRIDGSWLEDARSRWLGRCATGLAAIIGVTVFLHWLAFRFDHLPMPLSRTAIYLIPLCTLFAGLAGAGPSRSRASDWLRRGIGGAFACLAFYFLLCLRMNYFKEYEYDADVKDVYQVLARLNHAYGVSDVAIDGLYVSSMNFYRIVSTKESFPEFKYLPAEEMPSGKSVYVLHGPYEKQFIDKEGLTIIYRGEMTDVVVAVKPGGRVPPCPLDASPGIVSQSY